MLTAMIEMKNIIFNRSFMSASDVFITKCVNAVPLVWDAASRPSAFESAENGYDDRYPIHP